MLNLAYPFCFDIYTTYLICILLINVGIYSDSDRFSFEIYTDLSLKLRTYLVEDSDYNRNCIHFGHMDKCLE